MRLASRAADQPLLGTITAVAGQSDEIKAAYRLLDCPHVTATAVLQGHLQRVRAQCDRVRCCLLIEDTTSVVPASADSADGLGPVGQEASTRRGFWLHSTLAVQWSWPQAPEDPPSLRMIGLFAQQAWARPDGPAAWGKSNSTKLQRLARDDRESLRWAAALEAHPSPAGCQRIFVADRESDIYEVFGRCQRGQSRFVIRLCQDRALLSDPADADAPRRIRQALAASAVRQRRAIAIPGGHGRKARIAQLELRAVRVTIRAPQRPGQSVGWSTQELSVVAVSEVDAPAGVEPVQWLLLSDLPIDTPLACWQIVQIYRCRWLIEEFHKGLKTGAGLEQSQLRDARRLMAWGAVLSVVTTWLLELKLAGPEEGEGPGAAEPAGLIVAVDEPTVQALEQLRRRPKRGWTRREVIRAIAGLGGFLGRKGDGEPGWLTIWRGWSRLQLILLGQTLAQEKPHTRRCGE